jgi:hypothetical protein
MTTERLTTPLQADLLELLQITQEAERDIMSTIPKERREASGQVGEWSPKDVLAHLASWRAIEARRLEATRLGEGWAADDPSADEALDDSNARLQARTASDGWQDVLRQADESIAELNVAIERSTNEALCECDDTFASIGANGTNHAIGHLSDIVNLFGGEDRYGTFARDVERVLARGHVPPRDSGVLLYNLACHRSLAGDLDDARRLLLTAFEQRHDLRELAATDTDLEPLRAELAQLSDLA